MEDIERGELHATIGHSPLPTHLAIPANATHKIIIGIEDLGVDGALHMLRKPKEAVDVGLCSGGFQLQYLGLLGVGEDLNGGSCAVFSAKGVLPLRQLPELICENCL